MATEAETPEHISAEKTEAREIICGQLDAVSHQKFSEELQKVEDRYTLPPETFDYTTKDTDSDIAQDFKNVTVNPANQGENCISRSGNCLESPSVVVATSEESCKSSKDIAEEVKLVLKNTEALENDSQKQKDQAKESLEATDDISESNSACGQKVSTEPSLENVTAQKTGLAKSSELSMAENEVGDYIGEKPSPLPIIFSSASLGLQEERLVSRDGELLEIKKQKEELLDATQDPIGINDQQLPDSSVTVSDEKPLTETCESQNIEEKAGTSLQKDETVGNNSYEGPGIEFGEDTLQDTKTTLGEDKEEASPTPDLINENLQTDPSIRGQTQNMEEDIYKTVEEEAYNKEGGINSNLNIPSVPIKYEEELSSSQEKKLKETEESSSTITGPAVCLETIGQKQETEHEKNESATDSLAISMAMTSPKIHKNEEETLEIDENTTHEFVTTTPTMVIDETSSLKPEAQVSGPPASAPGVSLEERNQETTESSKTMDDDNSVEDEIQVKSSVIITERAEIIDGEVDEHRSQKEKSEVEELIRPIEDVNEGLEAIASEQFEKTGGETYRRNKNPEAEDSGEKIETELVIEEDKNVAQKELERKIVGKENFVEASKSKITGATVTEQSEKFGELDSEDKLKSVSLKMSRNEYTTEEECTDSCLHKGADRIRLAGGGEDVNKQTDDDVNYQESIKTFEDNENDKSNIQVETTEVRYENQAERAQDPDEKTSGISSEKINEKLKIADEGESTQKHLIEEDHTVNVLTTIVKAEEEETKETKEEVYKELMTKTADMYNDNQNIGEGGAIEVNYTTPTEDENEAQMPKSEVLEIANTEKDIGEQIVVDSAVKDVSITATGEEKEVIEIDQDDEVHENLIDSIQDEASQKQIKEDVSDTVFSAKAIGEKPVEMISEEYEDSKGIETYVADKETARPVVELTSTVSVAEETTISNSQKDENHTMKQNAELGFETPNSTQEKGANLKDEEIYVAPQAVDSKETTDEETFPKESSEKLRETSSLEPNVCNPGIEDGILEHEESATDEFKTTDKTKITDNTNSDETELKCDNLILVPEGLEVSASSTNVDSTVEKEYALTSILSERSKEDKEGSETKVGEEGIQSEQILTSTGLAFMEQNVKPVDSSDETGNMQVHGQIKHVDDISTIHPLAEETVQEVGHESAKGEGKLQEQIRAPPQEQEHILELFEGNKRTDIAMSEQETDLVDSTISEAIQTNETEPMEVEKASESDCKEELENIEGNDNIDDATSNNEENSPKITCRDTEGNNTGEDGPIKSPNTRFLSHESVGLRNHKPEQTEKIGQWAPDMKGGDQIIDAEHGTPSGIYNEDVKVHDGLETRDIGENKVNKNKVRALDDLPTVSIRRDKNEAIHEGEEKEAKKPDEEVDDRLEATGIDDQIEKEVVHDAGDATEHLSMPAGEKTITREEPVEDRIEGDRKKVGDELETGDVGEDKVNKTEVCALDDLPIVSIREDKNEGMPKGDEKEAKKPDEEVEDRLKATTIDDQIKKEVVHEDGDVIEKHNMPAGEETITKGESVEDIIEGDKKEVYERLETTSTDDHNAKQIKHEDRVVQEHLTVSPEEKPIHENSTTNEKVAQNHEEEVRDGLEIGGLGEDKGNKMEVCALYDLPTISIRENKNERILEGEEKEAKKPGEEVDDRLDATGIDDQIEKEVVHDVGDATELLNMAVEEETITRKETVEYRIEGDGKEVYEELETTDTDDYLEKQIKHEDGAVTEHFTMSPEEKPMQESSLNDEKVAQNHEEEVGDELESGDVGEDKVNKTEVCGLDDLPTVSIREDKNEGMPEGEEKDAKKPGKEVEDRHKATVIDDQIEKEVVHEDGDIIEKHSMPVGEETITREETVEDKIEGDKQEVYEALEITSADDHIANQIKHEDGVVPEYLTVYPKEKPIQKNSTKDEKVAPNHEEEVRDGLETKDVGENKRKKTEVRALDDLPTISIREDKNEGIPEGGEKEAKKPSKEVDDRLEPTSIDDQIEKEGVQDVGDATELLSMYVEEETITREETVEDRSERDKKEVYEELETTGTDDHLEKQIKHEDGVVLEHFTMSPEEKPMQESSLKNEKVAQNHEEEVGDELETGDVGEDKVNKTEVCALDDLPTVSIREDKNEEMPEGEEKEAKKPGEEVEDRHKATVIDDQIEKEAVHEDGDVIEKHSMPVGEETITSEETVEDRIEGDKNEVYEALETTSTDDHIANQIKHEDRVVPEHLTVSPEEKPIQENSTKDEKVAPNHEEEVGDKLETGDVGEDKVNKPEVCALDDLPTVSIREDKNEGMPEGEEKEAKKPGEEVEDRHKATFIDDQIKKEVVHEDGDVIEKHSMPVGEETITREEIVEDKIEGDKQQVYEELETTGTNDHIEEHIKHEDRAITEHFTMFPKEKPIQENSLKDEKMAQNHKEEVHDGLETGDVGEDKVNKKEVCALDDLPTISNTEDKNEVIPEGEKKEANKLNVEADNQLEATSSDNQIEKEAVYEDGDVTEHLSMPAGEEIITRGETVENKIEGEEKEVYEELETTSTDNHLEKQIIHEDEGVTKQITVSPGLDLIKENSPKDEKVEQNHEKEVFGEIDTATVVKDAEKNITEDVVFMKPFTASTEEQIQERLETGITAAVEKQAIQVATTIQPYTVSLGEETIDESSKKDELYQEPNTICAREDAGDTIMKDRADEDAYVVSVGEYQEDEKNGTTQEEAKESDSGSPDDGTDSTKKTDLITLEDEKDTTMSLTAFSPTEGPPEKIAPKENIDDRYHASPVSKELEEQMKEIPEKCDNEGHKHDEIGSAGTESEEGKLVDASNLASGQMTPAASGAIMINSRALDVEDAKLDGASDLDKNESKEIILKEISEETDAKQEKYQNPELASVVVLQSVSPDIESITIEEVIASKSFSNEKSEDNSQHSLLESNKYEFETVKENEKIEDEIPVKTEPRQENLETPLVAEEMHMQRENLRKFEEDSEIESRDIEKQSLMPELELENHSLVSKDNTLKRGESTEVTEFDEKDKPETSEPGLEENQSEVNDQFDLLLNKMQKEDSITEEGQSPDRSRNELIIVEEKLDEIKARNDSHENRSSNTINNLTETLEANDLGEKPGHKCSPEELPKTEETGMDKETKNIKDQDTVCVENKMDSQCSQEDEKEGKNLETEYKLDPENKKDSTTDVSDFGQDIETKNEESDAKEITLVSIGEKAIEDNSVDKRQESNPYEEVSRGLETTCTDEHTEQESIKEHGNVTEHFTVNIGEKATGANSQKGEIQEHEEEVSEDLDLGKDGQNNIIEETDLLVGSTIRSKEEVQEDAKEAKKPQKELYKVYPELETANKSEDIGKEGVEEDDAVEVHNTVFTAQERMEDDAVEVHNTVSTAQERVEKDDDVEVHNTVSTAQEILRDSSQEDEEVAKAIGEVIQSDSSSRQNNEAKCGKENAETENWSYFERLIKKANSYPATEASGEEILDNADSKKLKDVSSAASEITEEIITEDISREVENIGDTGKDDLDKDGHLKNSEIISTQDQENAGAVNLEIETVKLENPEKTIDEVQNFTITPSPDQETIVGEFGGDCEVASKFEGDKLERASESMSEARVYETPILAEKSEHYTVGSIAERHNTFSVGGENNGRGYEEEKKEEETLTEAESNLEAGDKQNKETNEVTEIRENQTENQEVLVPGENGSATENIQISRDEEANKESYVLVSTATTIQEIHSENEKKGDKIKEESTSPETDKQTHEIEADEAQRVPEEFNNIDASNSNPKEITGEEELIEDAELSAKKRVQERHQGDAEEVNIQPNKLEIGIPCQKSKSESGETNEYMEEENVREEVSKSHENDTASQNIEEQVKKEKESLQGMYLKPMSEETIEPVHQEYKMDGEIDKDEAPKVGIEYQDPGLSYTCHTIENEEVKRSEQLVEPYIETEDPTTKGETTTITDGEECQIDTTTPARHATSNDAPYEPAKKLKEQSDLLPEEPIHESIRENPDDEGKANKNVSGGETKLDSEKLSEITPSPTTTTKELLMDDNHGASSLIRTSEKEMQGKQGETAKVEEKERPVFVEQVTEVNLAAETRGETDKDEDLVEEKVDSALKKLNECSIQEGISPTEEETQTLKKDTPQDTEMLTETLDLTTENHTHGEVGLTEDRNLEFSVKNTDIPSTPVGSVENTKAEISFRSTDIPSMPVSVTEKSLQISEVEDQQHGGESFLIGSELKEVDSGRDKSMPGLDEETIAKLKSETVNVSSSHLLQESTEDTMQMVGHSVDEGTPSDNKEKGNKEVPTTQNEEEEEDDDEKQKYQEGEEQDKNKMVESGSDTPVMVEASRDIDVKPAHKKSHNILSGVGSKVKQSISKVKKAITGKSCHHKQLSPK